MSEKVPFWIEGLRIDRLPGFPDGLKLLGPQERFHKGINIVFGPNASGKSSSARLIQALIWQDPEPGIRAYATANSGEDHWDTHIENGSASLQKDGNPSSLTGAPSYELRDRYMLALHELIRADDEDLAEQIAREAIGGFDLEKASKELELSYNKRSKQIREYRNYESIKGTHQKKLQEQEELREAEKELEKLRAEKEEAEKSLKIKELYEKALEALKAREELKEAQEELERSPKVLENADGQETEDRRKLDERIETLEEKLRDAELERKKQEEKLEQLRTPAGTVDQKVLDELESRIERLRASEKRIGELNEQTEALREKEAEALRAIGPELDPEGWKGIEPPDIKELKSSLQKAQQVRSEKEVLEKRIKILQESPEGAEMESSDPDTLKEGVRALRDRLLAEGDEGVGVKWIFTLFGIGILNGFLAFWLGTIGLLIGTALLALVGVFLYLRGSNKEGERKKSESDFSKTGLREPETWERGAIEKRLEELEENWQQLLHQRAREQEKEHELRVRKERLEELGQEEEKLQKEAQALKEKLGALPELPEENLEHYAGLYFFLSNVRDWQTAHIERKSKEKGKEAAEKERSELLRELNRIFELAQSEQVRGSEEAHATLLELRSEERTREEAQAELQRRNEEIEAAEGEKKKLLKERRELYERLKLEDDDRRGLEALLGQLQNYRKCKERVQDLEKQAKWIEREMEKLPHYKEEKEKLTRMAASEISREKERHAENAERRDRIHEQITTTRNNIERAKKDDELEKILSQEEEALEDLEEAFQKNLSSITGKLIVDELEEEFRDKVQHPVLEKASARLNRISKGRYRLLLDRRERNAFRAYDTHHGKGQPLSELSSGTRIQLLLSVRLAFIEEREPYLELPIIADELLANSDELRARAIIETLVTLAEEGRQVFYFTAQEDEVTKWRAAFKELKGDEDGLKLLHLEGESLSKSVPDTKLEAQELRFFEDVPPPDGSSHEAYGKLLEVPPFDLLVDGVETLHLWYLIEDPEKLHELLSMRIRSWGPLNNFMEEAPSSELMPRAEFQKLQKRVQVLERFQSLYRKGRPKPMEPEVLQELIDEVKGLGEASYRGLKELLEQKNGDPEGFLKGLENGELKGIGKQKVDAIREVLDQKGYLPQEEPMEREGILVRMNAFLNEKGIAQEDAERFLRRILDQAR